MRQIIHRWAPPSDNNCTTAYVNFVAGVLGVDADAPINLRDRATLKSLAGAVISEECARYVYPADVLKGVPMPGG